MTAKQAAFRLRFITGSFLLIAGFLLFRLYLVQVVQGEDYRARASGQYVRVSSHMFDRGTIYMKDKSGQNLPVADVKTGYILAVNPMQVSDSEALWLALDELLPEDKKLDRARFDYSVNKEDDPYEELATELDRETMERISEADLEGVNLYAHRWRYYPGGDLAAHVLGFMSYVDDGRVGTYGLERTYEKTLARGNESLFTNFFAEAFMNVRDTVTGETKGDLYLTIDHSVQMELETVLMNAQETWGSKMTGGIIMDPRTGAIVAMAASPSFDLNNYGMVESSSVYMNPMVENVYEMGSIVKPLTIAFGLDAGVITPQTEYEDKGSIVVNSSRISNYDGRARGTVTMQEVLSQSLNTGTAFITSRLGNQRFADYFRRAGLDELTGVDLPNEAYPLVDNVLSSPRDIEYVTASFGQGFAVSPLSITRALAVLANGGVLPTPHVVEKMRYSLGVYSDRTPKTGERVISEQTSEQITRMLVRTVDEALRGGTVALDNYSIAAKTGTAQIGGASGTYSEDDFIHTFFGYFPAYEPHYLIFLMNDQPRGALYASETLTDPFMKLTRFLINYSDLPPDRNQF